MTWRSATAISDHESLLEPILPNYESGISIASIMELFERFGSEGAGRLFQASGGIVPYVRAFDTSLEEGLSQADKETDYAARQGLWGSNIVPDPLSMSWYDFFVEAFRDLMLRILIIPATVSLCLTIAFPEDNNRKNFAQYIDTVLILAAIAIISIVQTQTNYAQQKAFMEINKLKNEFNANVIRHGEEAQILNTEVFVGDILSFRRTAESPPTDSSNRNICCALPTLRRPVNPPQSSSTRTIPSCSAVRRSSRARGSSSSQQPVGLPHVRYPAHRRGAGEIAAREEA
jgi:hypothetical protein